jgi:hypothetical protein
VSTPLEEVIISAEHGDAHKKPISSVINMKILIPGEKWNGLDLDIELKLFS